MRKSSRICVVGAGPAGLCSVDAGHDVTIFEKQDDLGGNWLYSSTSKSISVIYEKMTTNIPKEVTQFEHLSFETESSQSFIKPEEFLAYLRRYAEPIRSLINFNTTVIKIEREDAEWKVTVKPYNHAEEIHTFDVIFVCNGHFRQLRIPECAKQLKTPWIHSFNYRNEDEYRDKTVAIVGSGPSGTDIGIQVSKVVKKVYLLHSGRYKLGKPDNFVDRSRLVDVNEDGHTLLLENGEELEDVSAVIFCTGYKYEVPFFEDDIVEVKADGNYISSLYLHLIHTKFPTSLFFIGLCWLVLPFFDLQVHYALKLVDGKTKVPSQDEMDSFEPNRLREIEEAGLPLTFYHFKGGEDQWLYVESLANLANLSPPVPVIRLIYDHSIKNMVNNLATFKSYRYRITGPDSFEYVSLVDLDSD